MSSIRQSVLPLPAEREVLSIAELNARVGSLIESNMGPLWARGELSNFVRAASGHCYFTLKDAGAQVRCVMFRSRARALAFAPREGDRVEIFAQPTLYQARGDFQLGVEQMRQAGAGDLYAEFLRLRARLGAEGLFDAERKRPIAAVPRVIGVVTSPAAAALRDVLSTLARRAPHVAVILYPSLVQGVDAPAAIVAALERANARREAEVLLLVRGGGSIEDLWAFNDERVARALAASALPVIAGVGHETDTTIADFVADLRAPTPTAAAVAAATERGELLSALARRSAELVRAMQRCLREREQRVDTATRLLRAPAQLHAQRVQRVQWLARALAAAQATRLLAAGARIEHAAALLPVPQTGPAVQRIDWLAGRLVRATAQLVAERAGRAQALAAQLELVSPQAVLERGYAIVRREDGSLVRTADDAPPDTTVSIRLAQGAVHARIEPGPGSSS